jgi:hypothetical protein
LANLQAKFLDFEEKINGVERAIITVEEMIALSTALIFSSKSSEKTGRYQEERDLAVGNKKRITTASEENSLHSR